MSHLGLETNYTVEISAKLNQLLVNYQIYYQNLRALHWNVKGQYFFQLHKMFEEYYNSAAEVVDEIAERILMLGATPLHTLKDYIEKSELAAVKNVSDGKEGVEIVVQNMCFLLGKLREINSFAADNKDDGTVALATEIIPDYEKNLWMLKAWLNK